MRYNTGYEVYVLRYPCPFLSKNFCNSLKACIFYLRSARGFVILHVVYTFYTATLDMAQGMRIGEI